MPSGQELRWRLVMAKIFICYSHKDEQWKERVVTHLQVAHSTDVWDDRKLRGGDTWRPQIREAIDSADVAVVLVSSTSLTSDFIQRKEVPAILQSRARRVIPLIVRDCDWKSVGWLEPLQVLPRNATPLESMSPADVDTELTALSQLIRGLEGGTPAARLTEDPWFTGATPADRWRPPAELDTYEALFGSTSAPGPPGGLDSAQELRRTLGEMREQAPELAEAISRCAIPRLFDADVLGAVRGSPDDPRGNADLLQRMLEYTFVRPRRAGAYEYDAEVRRVLLEDWTSNATSAETFYALNRDLASFYWRTYERAHHSGESDLPTPGNSCATSTEATVAEGSSAAPLAEALYQLACVSSDAIYDFFEQHFDQALDEDRFTTCEALLEATRNSLNRIESAAGLLDKVLLREARLLSRTRRTPLAVQILEQLRATKDAEAARSSFHRDVLTDLGYLLAEHDEPQRALAAFEAVLTLTARPDASDLDRASAHYGLASPYWTTSQFDRALYEFREAIHLAADTPLGVHARATASGVLGTQGRWSEAWHTAIDALHLARTRHRRDRPLADAVARQLMSLLGARSPALIDTLSAEAAALRAPQTTRSRLDGRREHAVALRLSGQLTRATQLLRDLRRQASSHPDARFETQLLLETSLARIDERRLEEGIDICSEVLSRVLEGKGTLADEAMARLNRAMTTVERIRAETVSVDALAAQWRYVAEDAARASELCLKRGDTPLATVAMAYEELAREMSADVGRAPAPDDTGRNERPLPAELRGAPEYRAYYHVTRADIERAHGRWPAARANYRRASEFFDAIDRHGDAAQSVALCAAMAARQNDHAEAERLRAELERRRWQLAEIDRYRPSAASIRADEHNAAGVLAMSGSEGPDLENLERARASLRAARAEATPVKWFYELNLAYACAALEDWPGAAEALESSLTSGPTWWRVRQLEEVLREFQGNHLDLVVAEGERDYRERRVDEARTSFESALAALERSDRDPARRREVQARMALVHLERNDLQRASDVMAEMFDADRRARDPDAGAALGRACRSMVVSVDQYRSLSETLRATELLAADGERRGNVRTAQQALVSCLSGIYGTEPRPSAQTLPIVVPVILELGGGLVPADTSTTAWSLFTEHIPAFSARFKADIGLDAPPVRVRPGYAFAARQYKILIDEVRAADGEAPAGHPEPLAFIVERVEDLVRAHLSTLVGIEEVDSLIDGWNASHLASVDLALPDTRLALRRVLRELLEERVPLTRPDEILSVILTDPARTTSECVRAIRSRLKPLLPGNAPTSHRELIPEGWEESLRSALEPADGESATAVSPEDAHRILADIRLWLAARPQGTAVVVRDGRLRAVLRRLLQAEFPETPVLSQEEALAETPASLAPPAPPEPRAPAAASATGGDPRPAEGGLTHVADSPLD
jgi:tetratricopeptide (TPR) repeat protein